MVLIGRKKMNINLDTYVISDTHFGHDNIIKYCNRPEDHDFLMHLYWTSIVQENDDILHLGDVMWYKHDTPWDESRTLVDVVKSLPGNKFLVKGNHDNKSNDWWGEIGFTVLPKRVFYNYEGKRILFTHYPENNFIMHWDINIHGHIHNHGYEVKEENGRQFINVSVEVMGYAPVKLGDILREEV